MNWTETLNHLKAGGKARHASFPAGDWIQARTETVDGVQQMVGVEYHVKATGQAGPYRAAPDVVRNGIWSVAD